MAGRYPWKVFRAPEAPSPSAFRAMLLMKAPPADQPDTTVHPLILIVESDTAARELLVSYLEPQGYRTVVASTRDETLSKARDLRPDAITFRPTYAVQ